MYRVLIFAAASLLFAACEEPKKAKANDENIAYEDRPDTTYTPDGYMRFKSFYEIPDTPDSTRLVEFEKKAVDLGKAKLGVPDTFTYKFKNISGKIIQATPPSAECGCTSAEAPKAPIKPGESGEIFVIYDNTKKGKIEKRLSARFNVVPPSGTPDIQNLTFRVETNE